MVLLVITFSVLGDCGEFGGMQRNRFSSFACGLCSVFCKYLLTYIVISRKITFSNDGVDSQFIFQNLLRFVINFSNAC